MPVIVGKQRLVAATSAVVSSATLISVAAPSVGGFLAATVGAAPTIWLDAATYLVSALASRAFPVPSAPQCPGLRARARGGWCAGSWATSARDALHPRP